MSDICRSPKNMPPSRCWLPEKFICQHQCSRSIRLLKTVSFPQNDSPVLKTLRQEIKDFLMIDDLAIMATGQAGLQLYLDDALSDIPGAYQLSINNKSVVITARDDIGLLYGWFHLLRLLGQGELPLHRVFDESPAMQIRMLNHWDNMDGSVERGYAGRSLFFTENQFRGDQLRLNAYARLLASIGINALTINNVNVHAQETTLISDEFLPDVASLAGIFRAWGIRLFLSVNYASPMELGGLANADPLDEDVQNWWRERVAVVYSAVPDLGGFVVKADSEHRPGPFTYGRSHAEGANMLGQALLPYGGLLFWRCFVYNCLQDWRDRKTDRARAAYDHFVTLDGQFLDNVVLQIKNGPMDFQVREPVSPLLGAMKQTNQIMEWQITQEYTGQQIDLCWLVPQWQEILQFDTYALGEGSTIERCVRGKLHPMKHSGITAVVNVGDDDNWTGHTLAQANLYGYGRLLWAPQMLAADIAREWCELSLSRDEFVVDTLTSLLMQSWASYEKYTAPLGVGWMVNPHHHYGANVDGYEYDRWGTYHYADRDGVGVDRTSGGTGYCNQYFPPNAQRYNDSHSCPEALLLFFHHLPYHYRLSTGKTLIQHIYDTHFEGVEDIERFIQSWGKLIDYIDPVIFQEVKEKFILQYENACDWRDKVNTYFLRKSGVEDELKRIIYR